MGGQDDFSVIERPTRAEFPDLSGLSERNIKYCRQFYQFYTNENGQQSVMVFGQQPVAQIPWGHNILIFSKSKNIAEAHFYLQQTIENGWSRACRKLMRCAKGMLIIFKGCNHFFKSFLIRRGLKIWKLLFELFYGTKV